MMTRAPVFLALIALCGFFACLSPYFLTLDNLFNVLQASTTICLLAIAATFVIAAAGIDLSIGAVMALSGMVAVSIAQAYALPWWCIPVLCVAAGGLCGLVTGYFIGRFCLPAFIVTLGMLGILRGLALIIGDGRSIYGLDEALLQMGQGSLGPVPLPVIIVALVALAAYFLLHQTRFGAHTLAIGDNEQAAHTNGISLKRHKVLLYGLSGLLAGLAGLLFLIRINAADPNAGFMYELTAITAAIIGGTSLFGGRASIAGAIGGALLMTVLQNGLTLLNVPSYYQQIAIGAVLILAVALNRKTPCCLK